VRRVLIGPLLILGLAAARPLGAREPEPAVSPAAEKKDRGEIEISLRWRYEEVSQDPFADDARASTLRSTLAYRTPSWNGLAVHAEFEDVHDLGLGDEHANGGAGALASGVTGRPVIADPELTEINQVHLRYDGVEALAIDAGRIEILLADERFVGPVGFRQNHQSFDGLRASTTAVPRTTLLYAFVQNVNRINGGNHGMASHLLDAPIDLGKFGKLAPYGYFLDYDSLANATLSTASYGARWDGTMPLGEAWSIPIHAEAALQRDAGDNPASVDARYQRLEAALARASFSFGLGWELMGGSAADGAFQTPLATLHKFDGWADVFLTTPPNGIVDAYATAAGRAKALSWSAVFHDFESDAGSTSYGTEIDLEIVWKAPWKQLFSLAYATYDADGFATDTDKLWLTTSYKFGAKL
jgi:hypothetical protein